MKLLFGKKIDDKINRKVHQERHVELHRSLDELFADFINHGKGSTKSTVLELLTWSSTQAYGKLNH
jgi:hypothetical protein